MKEQKYSSRCTDVNSKSKKIPHLFSAMEKYEKFFSGAKILDLGCGRETSHVQQFLAEKGVKGYYPYDPYNQPNYVNSASLNANPFDIVTISNVLNVVDSKKARIGLILLAIQNVMVGGRILISVYEGDRSRILAVNEKRDSCQLNQPTAFYIEECCEAMKLIRDYDFKIQRIGKIIMIVKNPID